MKIEKKISYIDYIHSSLSFSNFDHLIFVDTLREQFLIFITTSVQLYRKIARDKNNLFSSHRTLRIFSQFFSTAFLIFIMRKYDTKKFSKNSQNFKRRK